MSSCCSVSAKSMICPRLRRVLVGFYSMVTRLGGLALVVLLVAGCGGGGGPPRGRVEFRHPRLPGHDGALPPPPIGLRQRTPRVGGTHPPVAWDADAQHSHFPRPFPRHA